MLTALLKQFVKPGKAYFHGLAYFVAIFSGPIFLFAVPSAFGQSSTGSALQLDKQSSRLYDEGQYAQALEVEKQALALAQSSLGRKARSRQIAWRESATTTGR
jgi:hypothetical protein